jgi:hypothetical protein
MCHKIRCDGKSEKNCKIFLELNKALQMPQTGVKQQLKGEREERGREEFRKQIKR